MFGYWGWVWVWMRVGCPCPPVRNDIVTPRHSFRHDQGLHMLSLSLSLFGGVSSQRRSRFERATRSLATFVRSHRSLRSLAPQRSASLRSLRSLALFTGSLTHFAHSLVGQLKFLNMCSHCYRVSREQTRFWRSLETRPSCMIQFFQLILLHVSVSFFGPFFLAAQRACF